MLFHRFYCEPLAQAAYLIAHGGEAVVVDPPRNVDEIVAAAAAAKVKVTWTVATHVHADFVAGLLELAAATGARVAMGERFAGDLPCERLADGAELCAGGVTLRVLATPGHTHESVCLRVMPPPADDAGAQPERLLTGDTLFLGDVGRPDLVVAQGTSARDMARLLFASLHDVIAPLPDATEVWPAHGAGSACGVSIASAASSTLALQRLGNWALCEGDREQFCDRLLGALRPPPRYFVHVAELNRRGPRLLATLPAPPLWPAAEVTTALARGAVLVDVRNCLRYGAGHWPGALNLALFGGEFEAWAGALLPSGHEVVLHGDTEVEAHTGWRRLLRVGCEQVIAATTELPAEVSAYEQIDAVDLFVERERDPALPVLDVRRASEYAAGHVPRAVHAELSPDLAASPALNGLERDRPTAVLCEGGYRSSAALAQLKGMGFTRLRNVRDGMTGWRANHLPLARLAPP
jgi:glyoxylase-like metal-dependent hydrolase (beta-lactamase superfamily II)